ncbi:MAG TPA: hypothetical protein VE967_10070 [Gemmatimonadaceae bacterium]|nr:hypothetical protein [Gemmatimonadaceae bacterium]
MSTDVADLESRIVNLERSMRRWKSAAVLACALGGGAAAAAFRLPQQHVIDADRIVLHSIGDSTGRAAPNRRIELSVGAYGGLSATFARDSVPSGNVAISPSELRLTDERGREVGRLGAPSARPLGK